MFLATGVTDSVFLALLAGVAAVVGHNWPVFLRFRGGAKVWRPRQGGCVGGKALVRVGFVLIWLGGYW